MMILAYLIVVTSNLLHINGFSDTYLYSSNVEAIIKGKNEYCLGECTGRKDEEECIADWEAEFLPECLPLTNLDGVTPKLTKRYRTIDNGLCHSNCGKFKKNYYWCITNNNNVFDRNYCTRNIALRGVQTYRTKDKHLTCIDDCTKRTETSYRCQTISDQQNCDPMKKVIVFNFLSENGKECVTPCDLHYGIPHCYNTDAEWKKCYLNPDASYELDQISEHMNKTRAAGVYTLHGYKECRSQEKNLVNARPLSVEDVARQYEESFPTVTIRYYNPKNLLSTERDPVMSYTVYNTFSQFDEYQVNLPLVIRAIITNHTLQREDDSDLVTQYNEMFPINNPKRYDEQSRFVPTKLGGLDELYNVFPQTWRNKQGSLAGWSYLVSDIYNFINTQPNSYAEYIAVVTYNGTHVKRPHRPTAVGLSVRLYKGIRFGLIGNTQLCDVYGNPINKNNNTLENMYFSNDPNFNCIVKDPQED